MQETLLDIAKGNVRTAERITQLAPTDEIELRFAGYHVQQAAELTLKHMLESNNIKSRHTCDISELVEIVRANYHDNMLEKNIIPLANEANLLTNWAVKTRYIKGYKIYLNSIQRTLNIIKDFIIYVEQNTFVEEILTKEFN